MDNQPLTPFQHHPWRASRSSSPVSIPSPRLHPSVTSEWNALRSHTGPSHYSRPYQFRSHTPPSLSPSPAPSSTTTAYHESDIEIEELDSSSPDDEDSGTELLVGEYEEAPENYGKPVYDSDEEDGKHVLFQLQQLSAGPRTVFPRMSMAVPVPVRKSKRRYDTESSGSDSGCSYDSGVGSAGSFDSVWGRRVRRRVTDDDDTVSVCSYDGDSSSENEIDMEL